jgi:molecular chaperone GrpE
LWSNIFKQFLVNAKRRLFSFYNFFVMMNMSLIHSVDKGFSRMFDSQGFQPKAGGGAASSSGEPSVQEALNSEPSQQAPAADIPSFINKQAAKAAEAEEKGGATEAGTTTSKESYDELYDRYIRLAADFENFRKRQSQEYAQIRQHGLEMTLYELLPVLDNLDRAQSALSETSDPKTLFQSFRMLSTQLSDGLASLGVKKMNAKGKPFDPSFHEAIGQQESSEHAENTVLLEQTAGYCVNDKVIRPAQVLVAVPPSGSSEESSVSAVGSSCNPFEQVDMSSSKG